MTKLEEVLLASKEYALTMARYNLWQNENIVSAVDSLPAAEREKDRGAFFGSIHNTLSHLYWGDGVWFGRFSGTTEPTGSIAESTELIGDWSKFRENRKLLDNQILQWSHSVAEDWFDQETRWYSGVLGQNVQRPNKLLIIQLFNHQTHHRGQIHAMLTAAGLQTEDTDLQYIPEHYLEL